MIEALAIPPTPPTYFERRESKSFSDNWLSDCDDETRHTLIPGFQEKSSSARNGTIESISSALLDLQIRTESSLSAFENLLTILKAQLRAEKVDSRNASENLFELRRLTGFTWERLADLLNVDRRTLHNWVKGGEIRPQNRQHIANTLSVLRFADTGDSEHNSCILGGLTNEGVSIFDLLKAQNYDDAKALLTPGNPSAFAEDELVMTNQTRWGILPLLLHEEADVGADLQPLPVEPKPSFNKRQIKRG